jgi:hypothetical protein
MEIDTACFDVHTGGYGNRYQGVWNWACPRIDDGAERTEERESGFDHGAERTEECESGFDHGAERTDERERIAWYETGAAASADETCAPVQLGLGNQPSGTSSQPGALP